MGQPVSTSALHAGCFTFCFNALAFVGVSSTSRRIADVVLELLYPVNMLLLAVYTVVVFGMHGTRQLICCAAICVWGVRLCFHLMRRCASQPRQFDARFDRLHASRPNLFRFLVFHWILVMANGSSIPFIISQSQNVHLSWFGDLNVALPGIVLGLAISTISDHQKLNSRKSQVDGNGVRVEPMTSGLWSISRHPNYFGEMVFWWSLSLLGLPFVNASNFWYLLLGCGHSTLAMLLFAGFFRSGDSVREILGRMKKDPNNYQTTSAKYQRYVRNVSFMVPGMKPNPDIHGFRRAGFGMGMWLVCEGFW
eukprot:TRINITY_DN23901_c0_g1_i1.p1 TRINITY_DN23901_c0_g1~~TRINITY_DN23901_c0_g1_i1.p1  ORF type:complete len:308 (-),score=54.78 TRINITY_DN23901_c0_g1_i1:118-1041(-)